MLVRRLLVAFAAFATVFGASLVPAQADTAVVTSPEQIYTTPGVHLLNDRYWRTTCSTYSTTVVRCTTDIYGTKVFQTGGAWYTQNDWVFNNLTYLPSPRANWASNPLGNSGSWTAADGRRWESECDTAATGRGACRNYAYATVASLQNGKVVQQEMRVLNSIVRFESASSPWVKTIPAAAAARTDVPVASAPVPVTPVKPVTSKPAPVVAPKPTSYAPNGKNCPSNAPIKGNHSSSGEYIYHVPGGQFYAKTNPERCFTSEAAARAAGFRASKR